MKNSHARPDAASPVHIHLAALPGGGSEIDVPCRDIEDALVAVERLARLDKRVVAISVQGYRIEPDEFPMLRQSLSNQKRSTGTGKLRR
jgi:hypothetical protein